MSDHNDHDPSAQHGGSTPLPPLADSRIDSMERAVFARIDRAGDIRRARRRGVLTGMGAAAAVALVAGISVPAVTAALEGRDVAATEAIGAPAAPESVERSAADSAGGAEASAPDVVLSDGREIVANGALVLAVPDVDRATTAVTTAVERVGGYVETMEANADISRIEVPATAPGDARPLTAGTTWIQVRVPSDTLVTVMDEMSEVGAVETSTISREDVTDYAVDVRARVASSEASVERLTALMADASSVSDLLAAEGALAERQATLEAYRQELTNLESRVSLSSLSVTLAPQHTPTADASGFGDGIAAGWNGLVTTLNGVVLGLGFVLPWLVVIAIAAAVVWLIVRTTRSRRRRGDTGTASGPV